MVLTWSELQVKKYRLKPVKVGWAADAFRFARVPRPSLRARLESVCFRKLLFQILKNQTCESCSNFKSLETNLRILLQRGSVLICPWWKSMRSATNSTLNSFGIDVVEDYRKDYHDIISDLAGNTWQLQRTRGWVGRRCHEGRHWPRPDKLPRPANQPGVHLGDSGRWWDWRKMRKW